MTESSEETEVPENGNTPFQYLCCNNVGLVKHTGKIEIQSPEVKTITGLVRNAKGTESAITEKCEEECSYVPE